FKTANDAIFGFETIITVYVAARLALDSVITVGMIIAFMSYKQQFVERAVMLVEKVLDYRLLGLASRAARRHRADTGRTRTRAAAVLFPSRPWRDRAPQCVVPLRRH